MKIKTFQNCIDKSAPLYSLSVEQFCSLLQEGLELQKSGTAGAESEKKYCYGLHGIMQLFDISHKTAQAWKNTWLAPACAQYGKTIVVDKDLAMKLFNEKSERRTRL